MGGGGGEVERFVPRGLSAAGKAPLSLHPLYSTFPLRVNPWEDVSMVFGSAPAVGSDVDLSLHRVHLVLMQPPADEKLRTVWRAMPTALED